MEEKLNLKGKKIKEKSFGAVIINEYQEFLLIKHRFGEHWDFPKGHKENDETDKETVLREVMEETGLLITIIEGFKEKTRYSPREGTEKTVTFYMGFSTGKVTIQNEEILDYAFLPFEDALKKITFNESKEVLKKAKNFKDTFLHANID
jgi:tRNA nucleotidyltransferase (CCA-adding enzyme)